MNYETTKEGGIVEIMTETKSATPSVSASGGSTSKTTASKTGGASSNCIVVKKTTTTNANSSQQPLPTKMIPLTSPPEESTRPAEQKQPPRRRPVPELIPLHELQQPQRRVPAIVRMRMPVTTSSQPADDYYGLAAAIDSPSRAVAQTETVTDEQHAMENKIFVWNTAAVTTPPGENQAAEDDADDDRDEQDSGTVTEIVMPPCAEPPFIIKHQEQQKPVTRKEEKMYKTVFKCPHCTFWAAIASRFHKHMVGHLNRKPFECSCCAYRSNWHYDITKHIRLRSARRDAGEESAAVDYPHQGAKVLMMEQMVRRNYSKYNRYLTEMEMDIEGGADKVATGECKDGKGVRRSVDGSIFRKRRPKTFAHHANSSANNKAAHSLKTSPSGKAAGQLTTLSPPSATGGDGCSKTVWKCKKCFFRDFDRLTVLNHVKAHYSRGEFGSNAGATRSNAAATDRGTTETDSDLYDVNTTDVNYGIERRDESTSNSMNDNEEGEMQGIDENGSSDDATANMTMFNNGSDTTANIEVVFDASDENIVVVETLECKPDFVDNDGVSTAQVRPFDATSNNDGQEDFQVDPEFGPDMLGNPSFNYPTTVENGIIRSKRYKCPKCPTAFDKRDKFAVHLTLHGARDKYQCDKCDYAVGCTANYVQHQRKHARDAEIRKNNEQAADKEKMIKEQEAAIVQRVRKLSIVVDKQRQLPKNPMLPTPFKLNPKDTIFTNEMSDQQAAYELNAATGNLVGEMTTSLFRCVHCPFVCDVRSELDRHNTHHRVAMSSSGARRESKRSWKQSCRFCTYGTHDEIDLAEHTRVHFLPSTVVPVPNNDKNATDETISYIGDHIEFHGKRVVSDDLDEGDVEPFFVFSDCGEVSYDPTKDSDTTTTTITRCHRRFNPDVRVPNMATDCSTNRIQGRKASHPAFVRYFDGGKRIEFLGEDNGTDPAAKKKMNKRQTAHKKT